MISQGKVWGSGGARYMEKMESLTVHPANLKVTKGTLTRASDLKNRCEHKVLQGMHSAKKLKVMEGALGGKNDLTRSNV